MKLACKDLSDTSCDYSAEGKTREEAARSMLTHARQCHTKDIESMSDGDVVRDFSAKVHE